MAVAPDPSWRRSYPKRLVDVLLSAAALFALSPLILLVALGVLVFLGRPILFRQVRPGLHGRPFRLVKFRSMRAAAHGESVSDAERLTRFGRFLRSTSLDELPELWNVLAGDMSLVGPRPLLTEYLDLYTPFQMQRHAVRPGITGWAQVNGRNAVDWPDRLAMDVWYVENVSFRLDLKILLLTLVSVVSRRGISAAGEATMPRFRGEQAEQSPPARPAEGDRPA